MPWASERRKAKKRPQSGRGANLFLANFFFQATLTPALSHWRGRGRIVGCHLENPTAGLAGRASAKPESSDICSFSQGEKVRMRASLSQKQICARRAATTSWRRSFPRIFNFSRQNTRFHRNGRLFHEILRTALPSTAGFGWMPKPGDFGAAMRPLTRWGAPLAVLTVT